jgi:hypothetical protein
LQEDSILVVVIGQLPSKVQDIDIRPSLEDLANMLRETLEGTKLEKDHLNVDMNGLTAQLLDAYKHIDISLCVE